MNTKVKAAALLLANGTIVTKPPPARHPTLFLMCQQSGLDTLGHEQGFITTDCEFVDRAQALRIAQQSGQLHRKPVCEGRLHSEDLW